MLNRFKHIMDELRGLIEGSAPSAKMLLAVSGGIDSMCLADLFLRSFGAGSFAVAHCNFHLRGEESDGDEALVARWAHERGVLLHKIDFETTTYASDKGISIEMAARELRYTWFADLCSSYGYAAVVVAHHADDNAETMMLNIVRGTGLRGLTGMKEVSPMPYGEGVLLRPMLSFTRKQIEGYSLTWKVPFREDSTNSSVEYKRNSIRHEVFPIFERMNPSYVRAMSREMTYFSDAAEIVDAWCRSHVGEVMSADDRILIDKLMSIPQWRYLLYHILEPFGFNSSVMESLENLLMSDRTVPGKRFESPSHVLVTERRELVILPLAAADGIMDRLIVKDDCFMPVRVAGTYNLNGVRFVVETIEWTPDMQLKQPDGVLVMDADKLKFPFVCRCWRNGDWMIPLGMRGKKKISDLFTDLKYGHMQKNNALMIVDCSAGMAETQHVAAVLGVRIDNKYKVTSSTSSVIRISLA